jgi:hypothetical protein
MNRTKGLLSELVYDFQSVRWNEFELPKLSLRELQTLAKLLGCPSYGTKETLIVRSSHNVNCASNSLASQTTLKSWQFPTGVNRCAICAGKPVFGAQATNALFRQDSSIGAIGAAHEDRRF